MKPVLGVIPVLVFGLIVVAGVTALLFPWFFYLGGNFHITPDWQGWGKLHAKSGDYLLFVRIQPTARGSRMYAHSNLHGLAHLCTQRGEQLQLHLGVTMRPRLNLSTDGEAIDLYMDYWPWNGGFITDHRPSLDFRGHWRSPHLVVDDQGSIAKAFQPDGTVYHSQGRNLGSPEIVSLILVPGSYSDFKEACATTSAKPS